MAGVPIPRSGRAARPRGVLGGRPLRGAAGAGHRLPKPPAALPRPRRRRALHRPRDDRDARHARRHRVLRGRLGHRHTASIVPEPGFTVFATTDLPTRSARRTISGSSPTSRAPPAASTTSRSASTSATTSSAAPRCSWATTRRSSSAPASTASTRSPTSTCASPVASRIEINAGGWENYQPDWEATEWAPHQGGDDALDATSPMPDSMMESLPAQRADGRARQMAQDRHVRGVMSGVARVLVVGGGIGGLCTAIALRRIGCRGRRRGGQPEVGRLRRRDHPAGQRAAGAERARARRPCHRAGPSDARRRGSTRPTARSCSRSTSSRSSRATRPATGSPGRGCTRSSRRRCWSRAPTCAPA